MKNREKEIERIERDIHERESKERIREKELKKEWEKLNEK